MELQHSAKVKTIANLVKLVSLSRLIHYSLAVPRPRVFPFGFFWILSTGAYLDFFFYFFFSLYVCR